MRMIAMRNLLLCLSDRGGASSAKVKQQLLANFHELFEFENWGSVLLHVLLRRLQHQWCKCRRRLQASMEAVPIALSRTSCRKLQRKEVMTLATVCFLTGFSLLFLLSLLQFFSTCCIMTVRFQENDLSLNVPISWVPLATAAEDDQLFPILKPSDVVNYLCQSGNFEKLFGEEPLETIQPVLLEFWSRFAKEVPDHQVFSENQAGQVSLSRSVPIMVHGDEGRNFKRKGIMLISFEGVVGKGARPFVVKNAEKTKKLTMGVNIGGHSFCSRFLCAAMQRKCYNQNPEAKCALYMFFCFQPSLKGFCAATMFDQICLVWGGLAARKIWCP